MTNACRAPKSRWAPSVRTVTAACSRARARSRSASKRRRPGEGGSRRRWSSGRCGGAARGGVGEVGEHRDTRERAAPGGDEVLPLGGGGVPPLAQEPSRRALSTPPARSTSRNRSQRGGRRRRSASRGTRSRPPGSVTGRRWTRRRGGSACCGRACARSGSGRPATVVVGSTVTASAPPIEAPKTASVLRSTFVNGCSTAGHPQARHRVGARAASASGTSRASPTGPRPGAGRGARRR